MKKLAPRLVLPWGAMLWLIPTILASVLFVRPAIAQAPLLTPAAFDEGVAREVVQLTEAAYCTAEQVGWNCTVCHAFPGMKNVSVIREKSRNVRGFVGVDIGGGSSSSGGTSAITPTSTSEIVARPHLRSIEQRSTAGGEGTEVKAAVASSRRRPRPRIVVTFAGTDPKSMKNWIDDLEAAPIAHPYDGNGCEECKVHRGFLATYEVVKDQVRETVARHLRHNPDAEILITGHSLGGALATLCFLDLQLTLGLGVGPDAVPFAPLYIFGAPRVGNEAFAKYSVAHGVPIFRVVHNHDPVPHLPFEAWGYHHPPTEIFLNADQTSYVVCNDSGEDSACSDQFWVIFGALHIKDHLSYLEADYTKAYIRCVTGESGEDGEDQAGLVQASIPVAPTAMVA